MSDFLFRGSLKALDPEVYELTQVEAERQARKLILIPSESQAPLAVRDADLPSEGMVAGGIQVPMLPAGPVKERTEAS